jgi:hypothetical protein
MDLSQLDEQILHGNVTVYNKTIKIDLGYEIWAPPSQRHRKTLYDNKLDNFYLCKEKCSPTIILTLDSDYEVTLINSSFKYGKGMKVNMRFDILAPNHQPVWITFERTKAVLKGCTRGDEKHSNTPKEFKLGINIFVHQNKEDYYNEAEKN